MLKQMNYDIFNMTHDITVTTFQNNGCIKGYCLFFGNI